MLGAFVPWLEPTDLQSDHPENTGNLEDVDWQRLYTANEVSSTYEPIGPSAKLGHIPTVFAKMVGTK